MARLALLLSILLSYTGPAQAANKSSDQPNVLLLMGDDHSAFAFGAYGDDRAKTPHLDRFAASATRFDQAYVNCPMCTPSRQSLLTGRLPHSVGVTVLQTPLSEEPVTLADLLKSQGYDTAAIGKMHFNSQRKHGFDLLVDTAEHRAFLKEKGERPVPEGLPVFPPWKPFKDPARIWLNSMMLPTAAYDQDMESTWFAAQAEAYLGRERETPFFLVVSFREPHSPFRFPIEYTGRFDPSSFPVPEIGPEDDGQIPAIFRDLTPAEKQGITASYYTSVAFLDRNIGTVLEAVRANDLEKDTLIVYLGDHGYHLGHHGRFEKHSFYERAVRAPLLIRLPGGTQSIPAVRELVEFIDLFPTIVEIAGATPPSEVEGRSLLPLLMQPQAEGREWVFSEYHHNAEAMVRTDRYKYIYQFGNRERDDGYATGKPLPGRTRILFDLEKDPEEFHNLAGEAQYASLIDDLETKMLARFEASFPREMGGPPEGLSRGDKLDWYLQIRDLKD